jgi:hypothetical protein
MAAVSGKKTLIWFVVLLALAAFYYVYEIQGSKSRREVARQRGLLLHFATHEATGLTLTRPTDTITAVQRQDHWHLTEPLSVPGDDRKFRELVRHLAELSYLRRVEEHPTTLEPFGLTSPALEIRLQLKEQTQPLLVRLGAQNPLGDGYYTQVEGRPPVYLINTASKDVLDASLYDLRDKTVLAFEPSEVREVRLDAAATTPVVLQRLDDERWQMTVPVRAAGDSEQVQALLQRLREVHVQAFVAEAPDNLEPYGLQSPTLRLTLTTGTDQPVKSLLFGKLDSDHQGVYAKRRDAAGVILLPQKFWDDLPKTAAVLRDKTLLQYDREHITQLEFQSAGEAIVITRTGPHQYRLEQPVSDAADGDAMANLLWDLKEIKAKDFIAEAPVSLASYGLEPPRLRVTLSEKPAGEAQEAKQHTVLFGGEASEPQGVYVQVATRPTVYLVDRSAAQRILEVTAFDLREKKILAFDTETVHKVHLQYPTAALTLQRRGDTWQLSEPTHRDIQQPWKVTNLLYELSTLEYARIVTEPTDNDARYGFDTPQVQITLWPESGTAIGPLVIGKAAKDPASSDASLVYARAGSGTRLYVIKADFLANLSKTLTDLTASQ